MDFSFVKMCFMILYLGMSVILILLIPYVRKRDGAVGRQMRAMLGTAAASSLFYLLGFVITNQMAALLFYSFFFISCIVFLALMLEYVIYQTGILLNFVHFITIPVYALAALDGVFMLYNNIDNVLFEVATDFEPYVRGDAFSTFQIKPLFCVHLGLCIAMGVAIIVLLAFKTVTVSAMYRDKFVFSMVGFALVAFGVGVGVVLKATWGFAGFCCSLNALFTFAYSLRHHYSRLAYRLLELTAKDLQSAMMIFDQYGNCIYANDFAKKMFKLDDENTSSLLKAYLSDRLPEMRYEALQEGIITETRTYGKTMLQLESDYKRLYDRRNRFVGFFLFINDRTRLMRSMEDADPAERDDLTKLYSKEGFEKKVRELLKNEPEVKRTIVCSDIKDFSIINKSFGESVANGLLINLGQILSKYCEGTDSIPARLGADRFAICMRTDRYSDELFSEVARTSVKLPNNKFYKVVCYVGVYDEADPGIAVEEMCHRAFLAVESIKGDYNKVLAHYDSKQMREGREKEQAVIEELKKAIDSNQFKAYIQPQVNTADQAVLGGEVLTRWVHSVKGMIAPESFLPIFERTGLITAFDRFVWNKACETLNYWREQGYEDRFLSVNVSPRDFYNIDIFEELKRIAENTGVNPGQLVVELPESSVMQDVTARTELIEKLKSFGFRTALDNVGRGTAGLDKLKLIPTEIIKIDHTLMKKAFTDKKAEQAIKTIIDVAHEAGKEVVAEGVESQAQADMLKEFACDRMQGFHFAKPMPIEEFEVMYFDIKGAEESVDELLDEAEAIVTEGETAEGEAAGKAPAEDKQTGDEPTEAEAEEAPEISEAEA